jgi:hypothetical protein
VTAVLTVVVTRNRDAVEFDCEHATTSLTADSATGAEQLALVRVVMARHAASCACQPQEIRQVWPSMAEAIAIHEEDEGDGASAATHLLRSTNLAEMRRRRCPACDPEAVMTTRLGYLEIRINHKRGCPVGSQRGRDRRVQILDLAEQRA